MHAYMSCFSTAQLIGFFQSHKGRCFYFSPIYSLLFVYIYMHSAPKLLRPVVLHAPLVPIQPFLSTSDMTPFKKEVAISTLDVRIVLVAANQTRYIHVMVPKNSESGSRRQCPTPPKKSQKAAKQTPIVQVKISTPPQKPQLDPLCPAILGLVPVSSCLSHLDSFPISVSP